MKKVKLRYDRIAICLVALILLIWGIVAGIKAIYKSLNPELLTMYLASENNMVTLYNKDQTEKFNKPRGTEVVVYKDTLEDNYVKIKVENEKYYVENSFLTDDYQKVVTNKNIYLRTMMVLKENETKISTLVKKGSTLNIVGFDELDSKGNVTKYKLSYDEKKGYISNEYLVETLEEASKKYDEDGANKIHAKRETTYGGNAGDLDFYPREKGNFKDNKMPEKVSALYLNGSAILKADEYINLAKGSNVNAFIVDIKDGVLSYKSEVANKYSKTSYKNAIASVEKFKENVDKLKKAGFYVVGRITLFKDNDYALDNVEDSITDTSGKLYKHNGSYWPSAFSTHVWEYNVELALESIELFGFNEIQFDYVRFPDGTSSLEKAKTIDMKNKYNISKMQAIQTFLIYATDVIHSKGVYVSADVFGECAHDYANSYGQYWGAISNTVDVISAMPYPDHFNKYQYGFTEPVWTIPYKLLNTWAKSALKRQAEISSPAIIRTWIGAYNVAKEPKTIYDEEKIKEQIKGLEDAGATGGYMTWNSSSNLQKYAEIINGL